MIILISDLYLKKNILDIYNNDLGICFKIKGETDNVIYKAYDAGIYSVRGDAAGHPLQGYSGYMLVMSDKNIKIIVKVLFLYNTWVYMMSQKWGTGEIMSGWSMIHGA